MDASRHRNGRGKTLAERMRTESTKEAGNQRYYSIALNGRLVRRPKKVAGHDGIRLTIGWTHYETHLSTFESQARSDARISYPNENPRW